MFGLGSSSSRRSRTGSEISSRSERKRDDNDETPSRRRSRAESTVSSSSKRKSSHREDPEREDNFNPSSASKNSYNTVAAPSDISSYVTAYNVGPETDDRPATVMRGESMTEPDGREERQASRRDSTRSSKTERRRTLDEQDYSDRKSVARSESDKSRRRDSKRSSRSSKSERKESTRAADDAHEASLPGHQFFSEPTTYTAPYRPPGHAADYYGDQGESVQYQPGVRPNPPSFVVNADMAHLHTPSAEAKPPPEPSSIGQQGASASFYAQISSADEGQAAASSSSRPSRLSKPSVHDINGGSARTSPAPNGRIPSSASGLNSFGAAAMGAGMGAAASYYMGADHNSHAQQSTTSFAASSAIPQYQASQIEETQSPRPIKPGRTSSQGHGVGTAAAMGLAGAAAGAYYSNHHNQQHGHQGSAYPGPDPNFALGQNQSAFPALQHRQRHKHRGPISRFVDWFKDPDGVAQFEEWSEYVGVCKDCFDPGSTPADAPRKHHHHRRRKSVDKRYGGSTLRIDKPYRYSSSSSDDDRKKKSSTLKKAAVVGLTGLGAAKVGQAMYKSKHDFDDTYSVQSGQPATDAQNNYMMQAGSQAIYQSRHSSNEDLRTERRSSVRKSRRDTESSYKRRGSSSSDQGRSRGAALSVAGGAAGLAIAAEAAHRRKSRSRSQSPSKRKKKYYSKRISPRHSYVDLSSTASGPAGFGSFFSSPSANAKKGKKSKGLFTFSNASTSSSDADLAFGEGTVRRKVSKKTGRDESKKRKDGAGWGDTAAIMGLAATGAALAAESDRRKSKGKDRRMTDSRTEYDPRTPPNKINLHDHETTTDADNDDIWEDASDNDSDHSVDTALAYGSRASAAQSRESLASDKGTDKWAWRWDKNKDKREQKAKQRREPFERPDSAFYDPFKTAESAAAIRSHEPSPMTGPPASMQFIDPMPISNGTPTQDPRNISSYTGSTTPQNFASASAVSLAHPQPVSPEALQPVTLDRFESAGPLTAEPEEISVPRERRSRADFDSREPSTSGRRDRSPFNVPPLNASTLSRSSVAFQLTDEQLENEKRMMEKDERRRRKREKQKWRMSADPETFQRLNEEDEPQTTQSGRRRSASMEISSSSREAEIDAELERLYAERRKRKAEKRKVEDERQSSIAEELVKAQSVSKEPERRESIREKKSSVATDAIAAAAVAAGAGIAASELTKDRKKSATSEDENKPRRRSSIKKEPESPQETPRESQQQRLARMAAQRVKSGSKTHEDYGTFFTPSDIAEHVKERNEAAQHRDDSDAQVVEIVPGGTSKSSRRNTPFDPENYRPFGLEPEDDPLNFPWMVPRLGLIEPTPPHSRTHSERDATSPLMTAKDRDQDEQANEETPQSPEQGSNVGSRVTWGDHDTYVYEVMTPEYERVDPVEEAARVKELGDQDPVPAEIQRASTPEAEDFYGTRSTTSSHHDDGGVPEDFYRPGIERVFTLDNDKQEGDFLNQSADERPPRERSMSPPRRTREPNVVNIEPDVVPDIRIEQHDPSPEASPVFEADLEDLLKGRGMYQAPFAETVSDIALGSRGPVPNTGPGFVESLPETPAEENVPGKPDSESRSLADTLPPSARDAPRPSKSDQRRKERALSSSETPPFAPSPPAYDDSQRMPGGFDAIEEESTARDKASSPPVDGAAMDKMRQAAQAAALAAIKKQRRASEMYIQSKEKSTKPDYTSDPEDWEKSPSSRKSQDRARPKSDAGIRKKEILAGAAAGAIAAAVIEPEIFSREGSKTAEQEPDFYSGDNDKGRERSRSKRKSSRRESEIFEDNDAKSVASVPGTRGEESKSRKRSKGHRDDPDDDEDSRSAASTSAARDDDKKSRRKSKRGSEVYEDDENQSPKSKADPRLEKKRSGSLFSNIFSSSKSDVSTPSKKTSRSKSEGFIIRDEVEESKRQKKRRSRGSDFDETTSAVSERSQSQRSEGGSKRNKDKTDFHSREQSTDDGFVSATENTRTLHDTNGHVSGADEESFLAERPEMPEPTDTRDIPTGTDGVLGLQSTEEDVTGMILPDTTSPTRKEADVDSSDDTVQNDNEMVEPSFDFQSPVQRRNRGLSAIQTADIASSPVATNSPTAVPLHFRRPPITPRGSSNREVMSSPLPPPVSPLATPKSRQGRPKSTEFTSKEVRPLYLVERHASTKTVPTPEEESYPSLPSSRTTSVEDLRGLAERDEDDADFFSGEIARDRGRRHSWQESTDRRHSPEYLDSRAATPVPSDRQRARESKDLRERKELPKHLFHSPSELLQDPTQVQELQHEDIEPHIGSPLPSVVSMSTDLDQEFLSAESRAASPDEERRVRSRSPSKHHRRSKSLERSSSGVATGLGILGGTAAGLAVAHAFDRAADDREQPAEPINDDQSRQIDDMLGSSTDGPLAELLHESDPVLPKTNDAVTSLESTREVTTDATPSELQNEPSSVPETEIEDLPQKKTSKKAKKDKKKRKSQPFTETEPDVATEIDPEVSRLSTEPQIEELTQDANRDLPVDESAIQPDASIDRAVEDEEVDVQESTAFVTKKSKKDKKKRKSKGRIDDLTEPIELTPSLEVFKDAEPTADEESTREIPTEFMQPETSISAEMNPLEEADRRLSPAPQIKDEEDASGQDPSLEDAAIVVDDTQGDAQSELEESKPHLHLDTAEATLEHSQTEPDSVTATSANIEPASTIDESARDFVIRDPDNSNSEPASRYDSAVGTPAREHKFKGGYFSSFARHSTESLGLYEDEDDSPLEMSRFPHSPSEIAMLRQQLPKFPTRETWAPTAEEISNAYNDLGAFELAFERAVKARGLGPGVNRNEAIEMFLPKRDNAPFIPKGDLTPIGELSRATTPANQSPASHSGKATPAEISPRVERTMSGMKAKKEKRKKKAKRDSKLREEYSGDEAASTPGSSHTPIEPASREDTLQQEQGHDREIPHAGDANDDHKELKDSLSRQNPFGNDFEVAEDELKSHDDAPLASETVAPHKIEQSVLEKDESPVTRDDQVGDIGADKDETAVETHETDANPVLEAGNYKDSTIEDPALGPDLVEQSRDIADEPVAAAIETPEGENDDDISVSTGKKAKKGKKSKKSKALDWTDVATPAIVAAGAGAATAALLSGEKADETSKAVEDTQGEVAEQDRPDEQNVGTKKDFEAELSLQDAKPWDYGLSGKDRKKREKQMRKSGTWDARITQEMIDEASETVKDVQGDVAEEDIPGEQSVDVEEDVAIDSRLQNAKPWDFGLNAKEKKRQEKQMRKSGTWDARITQEMIDEDVARSHDKSKMESDDGHEAREMRIPDELVAETHPETLVQPTAESEDVQDEVAQKEADNETFPEEQPEVVDTFEKPKSFNFDAFESAVRTLTDAKSSKSSLELPGAQPNLESSLPDTTERDTPAGDEQLIAQDSAQNSVDKSLEEDVVATEATVSRTEEPGELAKTLEPEAEVAEIDKSIPVIPIEDEWAMPAKKSKKDKKKKRKSSAYDAEESTPTVEAELSPVEPVEVVDSPSKLAETISVEPAVDAPDAEEKEMQLPELETQPEIVEHDASREQSAISANDTAAVEDDTAAPLSRKASKKEKKKKRKSLAWGMEESATATESEQPADVEEKIPTEAEITVPDSTTGGIDDKEKQSDSTAQAAADNQETQRDSEQVSTFAEETQEAQDEVGAATREMPGADDILGQPKPEPEVLEAGEEEWSQTSKKSKKNKRRKSTQAELIAAGAALGAAAMTISDDAPREAKDNVSDPSAIPDTTKITEAESIEDELEKKPESLQEDVVMPDLSEKEVDAPAQDAIEVKETDWSVPIKPSKKDKKKKRKSTIQADDEIAVLAAETPASTKDQTPEEVPGPDRGIGEEPESMSAEPEVTESEFTPTLSRKLSKKERRKSKKDNLFGSVEPEITAVGSTQPIDVNDDLALPEKSAGADPKDSAETLETSRDIPPLIATDDLSKNNLEVPNDKAEETTLSLPVEGKADNDSKEKSDVLPITSFEPSMASLDQDQTVRTVLDTEAAVKDEDDVEAFYRNSASKSAMTLDQKQEESIQKSEVAADAKSKLPSQSLPDLSEDQPKDESFTPWAEQQAPEAPRDAPVDEMVEEFFDDSPKPEDEHGSWVKGKRNKKGKKAKRGSSVSGLSSTAPMPAAEKTSDDTFVSQSRNEESAKSDVKPLPEEASNQPIEVSESQQSLIPDSVLATPTQERSINPFDAVASLEPAKPEGPEELSWEPTPKKSKRDKKKRKSVAWDESSTPVTPANEREIVLAPEKSQDETAVAAEVDAEDFYRSHKPSTTEIPQTEEESSREIEDLSTPEISKATRAEIQDILTGSSQQPPTEDDATSHERSLTVQATGEPEPVPIGTDEPVPVEALDKSDKLTTDAAEAVIEPSQSESVEAEHAPPAADDDEWNFTKKKAKKDKKKRGSSAAIIENSTVPPMVEEVVSKYINAVEPIVDTSTDAQLAQPDVAEEEGWDVPVKKGKKDKKKKKRGSAVLESNESGISTPAEPPEEEVRSAPEPDSVPIPPADNQAQEHKEPEAIASEASKDLSTEGQIIAAPIELEPTVDEVSKDIPVEEQVTATPVEPEEWTFAPKKTKKDKKKKRSSQVTFSEEPSEAPTPAEPVETEEIKNLTNPADPDNIVAAMEANDDINNQEKFATEDAEMKDAEAEVDQVSRQEGMPGPRESIDPIGDLLSTGVLPELNAEGETFRELQARSDDMIVQESESAADTGLEAVDNEWSIPEKKSKKEKKKKKRASVLMLDNALHDPQDSQPDPVDKEIETADLASTTIPGDASEEAHKHEPDSIDQADDSQAVEAKNDSPETQQPGLGEEDPVMKDTAGDNAEDWYRSASISAEQPADTLPEARREEHEAVDKDSETARDLGIYDQAPPSETNEDDSWATTSKKSKKDKKKRKSTQAGLAAIGAALGAAALSPEDKLQPDAGRDIDTKASEQLVEPEQIDAEMKDTQEEHRDASEGPREIIPDVVPPKEDDMDWGFNARKSKKDKKKKRASTFEADTAEPTKDYPLESSVSVPRDEHESTTKAESAEIEPEQLPSTQDPVETLDEWNFETKKSKKKKRKQSIPGAFDFDSGVATPATEDSQAPPTEPISPRAQPLDEPVSEPVVFTSEPTEEASKNTEVENREVVEDTWAEPTKRSKKDKKKKKKSLIMDEDFQNVRTDKELEDTTQTITEGQHESLSISDMQPRIESPSEARLVEASEEQSRDIAVADEVMNDATMVVPEVELATDKVMDDTMTDGTRDGVTRELSEVQTSSIDQKSTPTVEDNIFEQSKISGIETPASGDWAEDELPVSGKDKKKSKKSKKNKKASPVPLGESSESRGLTTPTEEIVEPVEQTEPTRELPVESISLASQNIVDEDKEPSAARIQDGQDSDNGSDVSATTRERRKRRRSPQFWTGEEPADLPRSPRNRALTPPPDHDDVMDTALEIAAGMGFGASENNQPVPEPEKSRSPPPRTGSPSWSFANLGRKQSPVRDSGIHFEQSPVVRQSSFEAKRDSGYMPSPEGENRELHHAERSSEPDFSLRAPRPRSPTSSTEDVPRLHSHGEAARAFETPSKRQPSAVDAQSKERSSTLFKSSPAVPTPGSARRSADVIETPTTSDKHRTSSMQERHQSREESSDIMGSPRTRRVSDEMSSSLLNRAAAVEIDREVFSPSPRASQDRTFSPPKTPLGRIDEDAVALGAALAGGAATAALLSRDGPEDGHTKSLGRSKSRTGSLRNLRGSTSSPFEPNVDLGPPQQPSDARESERSASMADVFDGYGAAPGSPRSPTRPPSLRKRQSFQQIADLQTRVEQLASENRLLAEQKVLAERHLEEMHLEHSRGDNATTEALDSVTEQLRARDAEITRMRMEIQQLSESREALKEEHEQKYTLLLNEKDTHHAGLQESTRELDTLRSQHEELSGGMEGVIQTQIAAAVATKDAEIAKLRRDLDKAREKIRELQSKILSRGADEYVVVRDEDYFDGACQQLCQHVQQWVLRFSKYSDTRPCRATHQVRDEKIVDRFDNAILDGSDVDTYLGDRVKRRDVFMSVVMTMIWEFVFTRYLFGMDRDQRQKLKQLEKNLIEVGPAGAVHQWRALTLTLLSKRAAIQEQKESDLEAVTTEILSVLSKFLPPPSNVQDKIFDSLRNVMRAAVKLSIEMRTQKAEYIMLPPLQPEYDTNGDLARKVFFNASLMNERSGEYTNNDDLERSQSVVRMVLFPLVVKKGDDSGSGEEEIVVCPAQVLVAKPDKGKRPKSRIASGESQAERAQSRMSTLGQGPSTHSLGAMSGVDPTGAGNMI